MTLQTLGIVLVIALCAGMAWNTLRQFYTVYQLRSGNTITARNRLPDAPVPATLAELDAKILALGFTPKMTMQHRVAGQPKPHTMWIYEHPEFNIELDLTESAGEPAFWVALETNFADGSLLITTYPRGYSVDTPQVKVNFASYSLQEAFDHHLLTQLEWTGSHGEARPLDAETEAFFVHGVKVVKQHGRVLYGPAIRHGIGQAIASIGYIFVVLGISSQLLAGGSLFSFNFLTFTTLSFLVGLALAVGGNGWATRGKAIPAVDAAKAPQIDPKIHPLNRPVRMS